MKRVIWVLILGISVWSIDRDGWVSKAMATTLLVPVSTSTATRTDANGSVYTITSISYSTQTTTDTSGPSTVTFTGTDMNCSTAQYGSIGGSGAGSYFDSGSWGFCNRSTNNNQQNSQGDTKTLNDNGAAQATSLGLAAIAFGQQLVFMGVVILADDSSDNDPAGWMLVIQGNQWIANGQNALAAAAKMNANGTIAGGNDLKMTNFNDKTKSTIADNSNSRDGSSTNLGVGNGDNTSLKVDPSLLRQGKMDQLFTDLEKSTGMNRDDVLKGLQNGVDPMSMLANSPNLKDNKLATEDNLNSMRNAALEGAGGADGAGGMSASEMIDKLGLSSEDLNGSGRSNELATNGAGGSLSRGLASSSGSLSGMDLNALLGGSKDGSANPSGPGGNGKMGLSADVQAALDKNGITSRTIFEMVRSQYKKKTPLMWGIELRKNSSAPNPFTDLGPVKVDL